jgi:DNA-binding Lrp family transcriptional regulator
MHELDRVIINTLQRGFPICPEPFAAAAAAMNTSEAILIKRVQRLLDDGTLTRFGPLYNAEKLGGALSLCAMKVPEAEFDKVCDIVNGFDEVAHNYERDHLLNMWFVLATDSVQSKQRVIRAIEQRTGLQVLDMPKQREFFVGLHFEV